MGEFTARFPRRSRLSFTPSTLAIGSTGKNWSANSAPVTLEFQRLDAFSLVPIPKSNGFVGRCDRARSARYLRPS
ncbi:hypothetical protein EA462_14225 [Natrarchaeobius halalkaliphilus]|uniref:Uncharacterized protein n=1 Tax=Natrarchaeobius halalkaliphilus TaxID=1679091 RepID=A0A3N6LLJ7_9EURY|nr:hypothetical protein EA462_14225 [Natrarchaeobius halalkaliphilus]